MVVTVFKNRLRPGVEKEYGTHVAKLLEIAHTMPGFVAIKGYAAEDGEQLILVEFETEQGSRRVARTSGPSDCAGTRAQQVLRGLQGPGLQHDARVQLQGARQFVTFELSNQALNSSSSALASFKSAVSKPSVNQL